MDRYHKLFADFIWQPAPSRPLQMGTAAMGGGQPLLLQSMTNTHTLDIEATANQVIRIYQAGAGLVRITAQGVKEARALGDIKARIKARGYTIPLVADIHFSRQAAEIAAEHVEKVRINPGNYAGKRAKLEGKEFTSEEYARELAETAQYLQSLIAVCRRHNTAVRIGVNQGSLSDRIMGRYGDTPQGMVEAAMEFLQLFRKYDFHDIALSLKSSNTRIMVQANRLMLVRMLEEGMYYPLHLGVTEAGEGEDGRIRSAVGIGALLADGIGDTIRVSLSEPPENELPVARQLAEVFAQLKRPSARWLKQLPWLQYRKRQAMEIPGVSASDHPVVVAQVNHPADLPGLFADFDLQKSPNQIKKGDNTPDVVFWAGQAIPETAVGWPVQHWVAARWYRPGCGALPVYTVDEVRTGNIPANGPAVMKVHPDNQQLPIVQQALEDNRWLFLYELPAPAVYKAREFMAQQVAAGSMQPVVWQVQPVTEREADWPVEAAAVSGSLFIDGLGDGLAIGPDAQGILPPRIRAAFGILQAARMRSTRTEFISCPSCGRTLFDLESTIARVRQRTEHLKGLKIAIMGCIVNGPGEMADADYGYVGAAPGKVTLYKNKEVVKKNIPEEKAVEELVAVIKAHGDWVKTDKNE